MINKKSNKIWCKTKCNESLWVPKHCLLQKSSIFFIVYNDYYYQIIAYLNKYCNTQFKTTDLRELNKEKHFADTLLVIRK